jgi:hypothetical protein
VAVSHRLQSLRGDSRYGVLEVRLEASSPAWRVSGRVEHEVGGGAGKSHVCRCWQWEVERVS